MDCSTCHIAPCDNDLLIEMAGDGNAPLIVHSHEHGFRIYTGVIQENQEIDLTEAGLSPQAIELIEISHRNGCKWLNLDCDGPEYDELPEFMW